MKSKEKFLLLRHGGMGDNLFLTPVAKVLRKRGYLVDVASASRSIAVLKNNPHINKLIECQRFGPQTTMEDGKPADLFLADDEIWLPTAALYRNYRPSVERPWRPFNIANYFKIIEGCTLHPEISRTQISNYTNVYDNHLAWAGIDPTTVSAEDKRPVYSVTEKERKWAIETLAGLDKKPILLQTYSSSPAKSFSPVALIKWLRAKEEHVIHWEPAMNKMILDGVPMEFPEDIPSIRCSAALVEQSQFCLTADTCIAHIAEALGIKHISFYTITPAWTISGYYQHEIAVDSTAELGGQPCKCYQITRDCPRRAVEARQNLSKEDSELLGLVPPKSNIRKMISLPAPKMPEAAQGDILTYFQVTSAKALDQKVDGAVKKFDAELQKIAYCLGSIDLPKVLAENYEELRQK